LTGKFEDERIS